LAAGLHRRSLQLSCNKGNLLLRAGEGKGVDREKKEKGRGLEREEGEGEGSNWKRGK